MEAGDSILDAIHEELSSEDGEDVEMMDVEEGEFVEGPILEEICEGNEDDVKREQCVENLQPKKNANKKKKKKKPRKRKGTPGSSGMHIDRFVQDVCRRLRERKSYLVYTAVGVLGVSALNDLVKEVYAVQACGGQKTADGDRLRTGGGILWNILRARDPNAYKEIMKKGKDFEKQFMRPRIEQRPTQKRSQQAVGPVTIKAQASTLSDDSGTNTSGQEPPTQPKAEEKRGSVHDRLRVPVSYDDLLGDEPPKDKLP